MAERDPWFDNAKMALVTLVVVGHALTLLPDTALNEHLYDFVYAWHVPAFVLVTGYLSRRFDYSRGSLLKLIRTVAVPYLVFETAFALFRIYVGGETLDNLYADPHWPLWYLSALFFWRLLTPLFARLPGRPWLPVSVAVLVSLISGLWAGQTLDLARVFGLLPFFVLGLVATPEHFARLRRPGLRSGAVVVLAAILVLTAYLDRLASTEWLYYRTRYPDLDVGDERAMVTRAAVLVVGTVGALAFLALVPRVGGWFSRLGAATLIVYLFHGFVIKGLEYASYPAWASDAPMLSLVVTVVGAIGLSLALAAPPVASRLERLVDPIGHAQQPIQEAIELHRAADETVEPTPERDRVGSTQLVG
ncbi:acyltransferase family protein [Nocardioides insulae]|uniref:acyltransferase family protein n=1 Tax=Nocardioides insulae TaxID=394734 RepID=UPI00040C3FBE|nr:acyltransferase family protein [Nocardioides insulae]